MIPASLVVIAALGAMMAIPSMAAADWNVTQKHAQNLARQAAESVYKKQHVITLGATCKPQSGQRKVGVTVPKYHRWVCTWRGISLPVDAAGNPDPNGVGRPVTGTMIIVGNTGAFFSYRVIGGLRFV
jgi:hypothetical protein